MHHACVLCCVEVNALFHLGYELVDVSSHLVDLKRRPGLTAWYPPFVKSKDEVEYFNSYADYVQSKSIPGATAASAHDENGYEEDVIGVNIEPATDELKPSTGGAMLPRKNARAQERRKTGAVLESMWPPDNVEELNLQRWSVLSPCLLYLSMINPRIVCDFTLTCKTLVGSS
jgi:hypothetical protein